jgi:hypothetical protein
LLLLLSSSCSRRLVVHETPPPVAEPPSGGLGLGVPLVIEDIKWTVNDVGYTVNPNFSDRVAGALRASGVFSSVFEPRNAHRAPDRSARLRLNISATSDTHDTANNLKGFAAFLSLGLLAPVIELRLDNTQEMTCVIRLPGGETRKYSARCSMSLIAHDIFLRPEAVNEFYARMTSLNLDSIIAQVRLDSLGKTRVRWGGADGKVLRRSWL